MSGRKAARIAILLGVLALASLPLGAFVSDTVSGIGLLEAMEFAVPSAFVLGLAAVAAARRARFSVERSVRRSGENVVRIARFFAWTGLYIACAGGMALGFYGLLVLRGG